MNTEAKSASEICKAAGLPNLNYLSERSGVPRNTLDNWAKNKRALFDLVINGALFTAPVSSDLPGSVRAGLFLDDIERVSIHHGLTISHHDDQGGFVVEDFHPDNIEWLRGAEVAIIDPRFKK